MKSKSTLATIFILFSVLLYACAGKIPVTGGDPPSTATAEENVTPTATQTGEPSSEETGSSLPTAPQETSACQTPAASIKTDNIYLRDGPDIRFPGSARYKKGDQFTVLGRYKDWFRVEAPNGSKGWLYKDWFELPSELDTDSLCSIAAEELPSTPQTSQKDQKTPQSGKECVPTYYDSCP